ncbi:IreB family regulatory phosphoprotein [Acetohalobium arabaticum]|uniref:UPF0297 protein Acear_0412 n=1 Tax=Acetohalobium arabaticum (strain ATCC 49924 / DSM 5501 / Z-7288) TaxID=574087 RepID=D9QUQ0_ACEAZ|nr:IreB family regulatory phosphoprotein [Acetohalobium arabaticum]ADL11959.1 protein of unknown function DUF965 [Acetohalobium arabaticum DSM 5501]
MSRHDETMKFKVKKEEIKEVSEVLAEVYEALDEKGYNPINQIVGYILSGDPAYITSHQEARSKIRRFERDEIIEELVRNYLEDGKTE